MNYFDILLAKKLEDDRDPKVEGLSVNKNGTYSEDGVVYKPVVVALPLDKKTITANGTYKASDDDLEGYNEVEVEVPMPANAYLKKSASVYPIMPSQLPLPKAEVTFSGDKAELYVTKDGVVNIDNAPYLYRQSSGENVALDIVGGTIAWNQLRVDGDFPNNTNNWKSQNTSCASLDIANNTANLTVIQTTEFWYNIAIETRLNDIVFFANHIYVALFQCKIPYGICVNFNPYTFTGAGLKTIPITPNVWNSVGCAFKPTSSNTNGRFYVGVDMDAVSNFEVNDVCQYKNFNIIDLTQAFGSTIADAVYTMEQATAGSGIAWLKSYGYLTKDYYAYQSGKLESVNVSSRKVVGFNQWDEEWEVGAIDGSTGTTYSANDRIRTKNYIAVKPSTIYFIKAPTALNYAWYDHNKNYISGDNSASANYNRTSPSTAAFLKISINNATYNNDICINISDTAKNGTYEPYTSTTYDFDSSKILRGIPKLSNGQMYYDGDVMTSGGNVQRKYGVVDLGSLNWGTGSVSGGDKRFYATVSSVKPAGDATKIANIICSKYIAVSNSSQYSGTEGICIHQSDHDINIYDKNYLNSSASEFKTAMNGVYLVYELATPTTESATPFTNPQLVGGTEEFVDAGSRDVEIPVGNVSKYVNGNIYISYGTSPIDLATEHGIMPYATTYISSNGTEDVEYWEEVVS